MANPDCVEAVGVPKAAFYEVLAADLKVVMRWSKLASLLGSWVEKSSVMEEGFRE
jgi:hypothetical protein